MCVWMWEVIGAYVTERVCVCVRTRTHEHAGGILGVSQIVHVHAADMPNMRVRKAHMPLSPPFP